MSTATVLFNITYFVNTVLKKARYSYAWDDDSLRNALKWSKYCESVYLKSKDKKYHSKLDRLVKKLHSDDQYGLNIQERGLDLLKDASKILIERCLQNKFVTEDQIIVCEKFVGKDLIAKLKNELRYKQAMLDESLLILDSSSRSETDIKSTQYRPTLREHAESALLLQHFKSIFLLEENNGIDAILNHHTKRLLKSSKDTVSLLLIMLPDDSDDDHTRAIRKSLLDVTIRLSGCEPTQLWMSPGSLLADVCCTSQQFYDIYLQQLVKEAHSLQPNYTSDGSSSWITRNGGCARTFQVIVQAFHCLVYCEDKEVSTNIQSLLLEMKSTESHPDIFTDIVSTLRNLP